MQEFERDKFSNECITKAHDLIKEAQAFLKKNNLRDAVLNDYNAIMTSMKAVLAIDDIFPKDDFDTESQFRSRYIDNGMMSNELVTTLDKILAYYDHMITDENFKTGKPDAGYFTSKANAFVEECIDYIVQRNALYWGQ